MRSKATLALIFSVAVLGAFLAIIAPAQNTPAFSPLQSHTWGATQNFSAATLAMPAAYGGAAASGAATNSYPCFLGDASFSQCGFIYKANGTPEFGEFVNLDTTGSPYTGLATPYRSTYDYIGGEDRIIVRQAAAGSAPVNIQPEHGFMTVGLILQPTQMLTVGGSTAVADPSSLAAESLTNGALTSGTSWTVTGDAALVSNAATWTYSAGTASTLQQASGTLAIAGSKNRSYKFVYTVSGVAGTPTASVTSAFANILGYSAITTLNLTAGTHALYFQTPASPGNFVITSTLTAGQGFTLDTLSLKEIIAGSEYVAGTSNALHFAGQDTPTVAAGSAISTTPTITGSDFVGTVAVPSSAVTTGTIATVTFAHAYNAAPNCSVQQNGGTVPIGVGHGTPGTGSFTITAAIANASATVYTFDFVCSGN